MVLFQERRGEQGVTNNVSELGERKEWNQYKDNSAKRRGEKRKEKRKKKLGHDSG